jgi:hypothetical protein
MFAVDDVNEIQVPMGLPRHLAGGRWARRPHRDDHHEQRYRSESRRATP